MELSRCETGRAIKLAGEKRKWSKVVLLVGSWANARGGSRQALAEPPGGDPPLKPHSKPPWRRFSWFKGGGLSIVRSAAGSWMRSKILYAPTVGKNPVGLCVPLLG